MCRIINVRQNLCWEILYRPNCIYNSNRQQYVDYNGVQSSLLHILTGVPQWSILGPPLFLIYINDIINASKFLHLILFADDTNIFLHHSDLNILQSMSNVELDKLSEWLKSNRLSLNITKTNYIHFIFSEIQMLTAAN